MATWIEAKAELLTRVAARPKKQNQQFPSDVVRHLNTQAQLSRNEVRHTNGPDGCHKESRGRIARRGSPGVGESARNLERYRTSTAAAYARESLGSGRE